MTITVYTALIISFLVFMGQACDSINDQCSRWHHQCKQWPDFEKGSADILLIQQQSRMGSFTSMVVWNSSRIQARSFWDTVGLLQQAVEYIMQKLTFPNQDQKLLRIDIKHPWDPEDNTTRYMCIYKPNNTPPSLVRGALYQGHPNDTRLYTYGGTLCLANTSFDTSATQMPETSTIWGYGTSAGTWSSYDIKYVSRVNFVDVFLLIPAKGCSLETESWILCRSSRT